MRRGQLSDQFNLHRRSCQPFHENDRRCELTGKEGLNLTQDFLGRSDRIQEDLDLDDVFGSQVQLAEGRHESCHRFCRRQRGQVKSLRMTGEIGDPPRRQDGGIGALVVAGDRIAAPEDHCFAAIRGAGHRIDGHHDVTMRQRRQH